MSLLMEGALSPNLAGWPGRSKESGVDHSFGSRETNMVMSASPA